MHGVCSQLGNQLQCHVFKQSRLNRSLNVYFLLMDLHCSLMQFTLEKSIHGWRIHSCVRENKQDFWFLWTLAVSILVWMNETWKLIEKILVNVSAMFKLYLRLFFLKEKRIDFHRITRKHNWNPTNWSFLRLELNWKVSFSFSHPR